MKIMKYLLGAVVALTIVGCEPYTEEKKEYPELESLTDTLWWSYDDTNAIFYDITYGENNEGVMLGYSDQERKNEGLDDVSEQNEETDLAIGTAIEALKILIEKDRA